MAQSVEIGRTVDELRQVHLDAPPLIIQDSTCVDGSDQVAGAEWARMASAAVAARSDFVFEVVATRHRGATSDHRRAELPPQETHGMRRALVFASSFAELFASLTPDASSSNAPTLNPLAANSPVPFGQHAQGHSERAAVDRVRPYPSAGSAQRAAECEEVERSDDFACNIICKCISKIMDAHLRRRHQANRRGRES